MLLQKPMLFNPQGGDSFDDQALLFGNPSGVANLNNIRHEWAAAAYQKMLADFWIPQKVSLVEDKLTLPRLDDAEMEALKNTLSFLIFLDSFQAANLPNIAEYITSPIVRNAILAQGFQETIHQNAYQYILQSLFDNQDREDIYNRWRTNDVLLQRNKLIADIAREFVESPTKAAFDKVCVANYALEGVYFYSGFNFFDQLTHRGRLVQTGKEIDYIRRDEFTHMGLFANIIKEADVPVDVFHAVLDSAVQSETAWAKSNYGNRILGVSESSSEQYLKWLGNDRCKRANKPLLYDAVDNPYQHLEQSNREGGKRENFFETSVTSYVMAGSLSGWAALT